MIGVKFGDVHSYNDLGLVLTEKEIGAPEVKTNKIDLPGADGSIDLMKAVSGKPVYKDRLLSFKFTVLNAGKKWADIYSSILKRFHGQYMRIVMDDDPLYYYEGCITVNEWKSNKTYGEIVVDCDVSPFKYDIRASNEPWLWDPFSFVDGIAQTAAYEINELKTVSVYAKGEYIPTFESNCNLQIVFKGETYTMQAGTKKFYEIEFTVGKNEITLIGTGTVKVIFRECML